MRSMKMRAISGDAVRAAVDGLAAGLLTFLILGSKGTLGLQVWAMLIGWASLLVLGGGLDGLGRSVIHSLFGVALALCALVFATLQPSILAIEFAVWAALGVATTVAIATLAARAPMLGCVPASLLGYVSALVATLSDYRREKILSLTPDNPVVGVLASLILGALVAYAAEEISKRLRIRIDRGAARSIAEV